MPPLPVVTSAQVVTALKRAGFVEERGKGSHLKLRRGSKFCVVPRHAGKDLKRGTLKSIIDQAGLTVEEFIDLLDR